MGKDDPAISQARVVYLVPWHTIFVENVNAFVMGAL